MPEIKALKISIVRVWYVEYVKSADTNRNGLSFSFPIKKSQPKLAFSNVAKSGFLTTTGCTEACKAEAEEGQGAGLGDWND